MRSKKVSESETIMTEMVMPNDTNPMGNLMGGNLMRLMDIVASICAGKHCEKHVVTASVDHVSFQKPIPLGDIITIKATVTRAFKSSVEIYVEVYVADIKGGNPRRSNSAFLTFVGLDDETKQPTLVPQVIPLTNEEINLYESSARRRELRLILSGRIKPEEATELKLLFTPKTAS
ncbi:MAG: acyl-CoA thioesterase [Saprospiraceae bacterium]|nr:acyl-CoA thioesterase [Saprospiraceae bacterium]